MGVSLLYYDYGQVKGYVYEPTGIVVGNTTAAATTVAITGLTLTQSSTNIVGELVKYAFTGTISPGFLPITTTDYIVIQFDQNVF